MLAEAHVKVVDLTAVATDDPARHGKFASADVVHAIGVRLASSQTLSDAKSNLGETVGAMALNATHAVGAVAAGVATAPFDAKGAVVDQRARRGQP